MKGIRPEVEELRELLQRLLFDSIEENRPNEITYKDKIFLNNVITMQTRCPDYARLYIQEYNLNHKPSKYIGIDFELKLKKPTQSQ